MCPRDKHTRPHGIMDDEKYRKSIDEVKTLGAQKIVLTGFGEPLLDRNLEGKISYAKSKGFSTYVITNASALHARAKSLSQSGIDELRVSFYGMTPETYNTSMKGLSFERAKKGVLEFLEQRNGTKVQLSFLMLPENAGEETAFREFWEAKVDYIEIWKPHNFGDGRDYRRREGVKRTCGRPENGPLQIQWDGTVIPCCYDYNNAIVLGNAFERPVMEILHGERYEALRDAHRKGEFERFPYCNQCDQLLEHSDAIVYTNRHNLPKAEAVRLSNSDLSRLR